MEGSVSSHLKGVGFYAEQLMNCINNNGIPSGSLDRLSLRDITDKGSLNNYLDGLSVSSLSSSYVTNVNTGYLPKKDLFIKICAQKNIQKNNLLKDKLISCNYKKYKKWLLTRVKIIPGLYEVFPVNYAFSCGNFDLAKSIISIIEIKYSLKHNKKMPPLEWLIKKTNKRRGKQYLEVFMTIGKLYLRQSIDIAFFAPLLLNNPVTLHLLILYASEQNCTYGLKQLLGIASIKNSLLVKSQQYLPSPLKLALDHENVSALELLLKYGYSIENYIAKVISINNYFLFSRVSSYIDLNSHILPNYDSAESAPILPLVYSFKRKYYDIALTAICFGADINAETNDDFLQLQDKIKPLSWAVYHKNINMLDILLALGAKRYKLPYIKNILLRSQATADFNVDTDTSNKMDSILNNPSSLARLAAVSLAKSLVINMQETTNYKLIDIKQHIANKSTYIASRINSIEDLFSATFT